MVKLKKLLMFVLLALSVWALAGLMLTLASRVSQSAPPETRTKQAQLMPSPGPICGQHREMLDFLETRFGETVVAVGATRAGGLLEVLANSGTRDWTVIVVTAQGRACVKAVGKHWKNLETYRTSPPNLSPIQRIIPDREQPV